MAADKKAQAVGDILTILIQENNGATRQNNTTTSKKASVNASSHRQRPLWPGGFRFADQEAALFPRSIIRRTPSLPAADLINNAARNDHGRSVAVQVVDVAAEWQHGD